jgi:hypothetical protein
MQVTNNTSYDLYFGPLHLAANASNITIDDTSDSSLYLTNDDVADALNNAYNANKISVTGAASPFPRPTGTPQLLHGRGIPEGAVYAPPGSMFMRADNSGAGNSLYAKTTGRTFSTGWQAVGGQTAVVATSVGGLGPGAAGVTGLLRLGASPYEFLALVYDATYGHWVSAVETFVMGARGGGSDSVAGNNVWTDMSSGGAVYPAVSPTTRWYDLYNAGLRPQFTASYAAQPNTAGLSMQCRLHFYYQTNSTSSGLTSDTTSSGSESSGTSAGYYYLQEDWFQPTLTAPSAGWRLYIGVDAKNSTNPTSSSYLQRVTFATRWVG